MPWTNVTSGEEINRCVILARCGRFTVTELCEQFGISRETGYKHLERYAALVLAGLQPRSHRPHHSPQRTDEAVEALILAERRARRIVVYRRRRPARRRRERTGLLDRAHPPRRPEPPTGPDDQSHPPAAADPTDRAADTAQAASRLTTCQPKHTSLPEKTLKTLF